jgi:hypothetical protein
MIRRTFFGTMAASVAALFGYKQKPKNTGYAIGDVFTYTATLTPVSALTVVAVGEAHRIVVLKRVPPGKELNHVRS